MVHIKIIPNFTEEKRPSHVIETDSVTYNVVFNSSDGVNFIFHRKLFIINI